MLKNAKPIDPLKSSLTSAQDVIFWLINTQKKPTKKKSSHKLLSPQRHLGVISQTHQVLHMFTTTE